MYGSPYSMPPHLPPLPPTPIITHPPGSTHRSRSVTPTSADKTRIHYPIQNSASTYASATHTPQANKRDKINRTSTTLSKHSNGTYYTASVIVPPGSPQSPGYEPDEGNGPLSLFHPNPRRHSNNTTNSIIPPHRQSQALEPTRDPTNNEPFPFLDPHRKREVQTREEFIN